MHNFYVNNLGVFVMNLASCKRPVSACDDAQGSVANEFSLVLTNGAIDKNGFVYELACALQRGELTDGQSSILIAYKINLSLTVG